MFKYFRQNRTYWYSSKVQLTLTKIIKIVATRWRILRQKCTKFDFGAGGAYSAPPDPLAGFGGLLLRRGKGKGGEGGKGRREREGRGTEEREGEGRGRKGPWAPPHYLEEVYAYDSATVTIRNEGTRMWSVAWCHFQWPWVTSNLYYSRLSFSTPAPRTLDSVVIYFLSNQKKYLLNTLIANRTDCYRDF